jgi:hypothetical protein
VLFAELAWVISLLAIIAGIIAMVMSLMSVAERRQ